MTLGESKQHYPKSSREFSACQQAHSKAIEIDDDYLLGTCNGESFFHCPNVSTVREPHPLSFSNIIAQSVGSSGSSFRTECCFR
jgi:hypothetical protein